MEAIDFSLRDVVEATVETLALHAHEKGLEIISHIDPELTDTLIGDPTRLRQVIMNLGSNAIKFTPEGGRVRVSARRKNEGLIQIDVADTGVGIAEEDQQHIFDKFRQGGAVRPGNNPLTREHPGTGLGLSIVKELAKLLGGEVRLESELGIGSTFTVELAVRMTEKPPLEVPSTDDSVDLTKARRIDVSMVTLSQKGTD